MAFWYLLVMKGWRSLFMGKSSCFKWHISIHWFIIGLSSISPSPDCYFGAHHVVPHPNLVLFHTFDYTMIKSMNTSQCIPTLYLYILLESLFFYLPPIIVGEKTLFKTICESWGKSTLFVVSTKCWLNQHRNQHL